MFHFENIAIWTYEFTQCVKTKKGMLSRCKKGSPLDFQQFNHFKYSRVCSRTYAISRVKRKSYKIIKKGDFWEPYWWTKTVHQYGVSIQSSTKVRETFRQITLQKLWATKTWDFDKLFIGLLQHFIFLSSSTGRFPIYFLVPYLLRGSENEE